jgi:RimJ/RimL family protein N-acetyltransferase
MPELATPRLRLRPLAGTDAALYCALYGDPDVMRHIGPALDQTSATRSLQRALQLNAEPAMRRRFWVIQPCQAPMPVGLLALSRVEARAGGRIGAVEAEIGAMLLPAAQRQGYAAEAIAALIPYAFGPQIGFECLFTRHRSDNALARGLMRKLGFRLAEHADAADSQCLWQLERKVRAKTAVEQR